MIVKPTRYRDNKSLSKPTRAGGERPQDYHNKEKLCVLD